MGSEILGDADQDSFATLESEPDLGDCGALSPFSPSDSAGASTSASTAEPSSGACPKQKLDQYLKEAEKKEEHCYNSMASHNETFSFQKGRRDCSVGEYSSTEADLDPRELLRKLAAAKVSCQFWTNLHGERNCQLKRP